MKCVLIEDKKENSHLPCLLQHTHTQKRKKTEKIYNKRHVNHSISIHLKMIEHNE